MPHDIDITHIFYERITVVLKDGFGFFTTHAWRCRQCGFQTLDNGFHSCTSWMN